MLYRALAADTVEGAGGSEGGGPVPILSLETETKR
jgi:hypothetical protein